ncbi:MAG: folylpolyglutamate synthase/dihydrofolate synthase family protein [Anaerolineae bacterium]
MNSVLEQYRWLENELRALIGPVKFSSEINLRLERMSHLLGLLDNPHYKFRSIHVGGTSGKGSTSMMIASILQEAGFYVGLHTSPNLQVFNERHMLNGRPAATSKLVELYKQIKPAIEEVSQTSKYGAPSYFEAQTALTFTLFAQQKVDFAVIEVGLGGMRDATNVLPAEVAVLNNVGLDHTDILGDTVEEIVLDKRGIIKRKQQVVSGVTQPSVIKLVEEKCAEQDARLWILGRDFDLERVSNPAGFSVRLPDITYDGLQTKMEGSFQETNAAVAVAAVSSLRETVIPYSAILNGLAKATLPGRVEQMQTEPLVLLDGAHNPDKIQGAVSILEKKKQGQKLFTILGLKAGKAATNIVPPVAALSDELIVTRFEPKGLWEGVDPADLARIANESRQELPVHIIESPIEALKWALEKAGKQDIIWVTGSLYLVGDMREYWFPMHELLEELESDNED